MDDPKGPPTSKTVPGEAFVHRFDAQESYGTGLFPTAIRASASIGG